MNVPENLLYTKTHEWVSFDNGAARVGLTEYAAESMGDIVYFNLPAVGGAITAGSALCEVESVKAVSEIISPVSGEISAVNSELETAPGSVNASPYETWVVEIKNIAAKADMLTPAQYAAFCEAEAGS